jgi:hypothetical protein
MPRVLSGAGAALLAGIQRLKGMWFPIIQTSVASGLAWYLAADVLDHPQPFFAPIASAVCLSISNVLRAQRAVQMMIGVSLGIWIGGVVHGLIGTGVVPIAVAVLISLSVAVMIARGFIGQGMMFVNQTVVSSILVLALYRGGAVYERIDDALIGGTLAIVFAVLLFPANPLTVLRRARVAVLFALHGVLSRSPQAAAAAPTPSTFCPPAQWCGDRSADCGSPSTMRGTSFQVATPSIVLRTRALSDGVMRSASGGVVCQRVCPKSEASDLRSPAAFASHIGPSIATPTS